MHRLWKFYYIYLIPLVLSAIISLRAFREHWPKPFRVFSGLLWVTVALEVLSIAWKWELYKVYNYSQNNIWIYNAGLAVRFAFFLWFYHGVFTSDRIRKLILQIGGPVLLLLVGVFIYKPLHSYFMYFPIFNLSMIFLAMLYFRQLLQNDELIRLEKDPAMWISLGVFLYHAGTLPFFSTIDYFVNTNLQDAADKLYYNDVFNILMYTLFLIAFLCKPQPKPLPSSSSSPPY